jgi:hypothetical protein
VGERQGAKVGLRDDVVGAKIGGMNCAYCNAPLVRHVNETPAEFKRRRHCSPKCSAKNRGDGLYELRSKRVVGRPMFGRAALTAIPLRSRRKRIVDAISRLWGH